jgi:hypothetical protein
MRLARRRRGTLEISLTTLLESLVVAVLVIILLVFGYKLYQVFFGPDKTALNTYRLVGDNLNSLLQSPEQEKYFSFRFTFDFTQKMNELDHSGSNGFKGTIFGVSSDGTPAGPFPATMTGAKQRAFTASFGVPRAEISGACAKTACLCFSKRSLTKDSSVDEGMVVLKNPYECRSFQGNITFDFTQKDLTFDVSKGEYAEVLVKKSGANPVTVAISLWNRNVQTTS